MKKLMFMLMSLLLVGSACAEEAVEATAGTIDVGALLKDGLLVTAGGLAGVFLVLILFYFCIKMMQKIGK